MRVQYEQLGSKSEGNSWLQYAKGNNQLHRAQNMALIIKINNANLILLFTFIWSFYPHLNEFNKYTKSDKCLVRTQCHTILIYSEFGKLCEENVCKKRHNPLIEAMFAITIICNCSFLYLNRKFTYKIISIRFANI